MVDIKIVSIRNASEIVEREDIQKVLYYINEYGYEIKAIIPVTVGGYNSEYHLIKNITN